MRAAPSRAGCGTAPASWRWALGQATPANGRSSRQPQSARRGSFPRMRAAGLQVLCLASPKAPPAPPALSPPSTALSAAPAQAPPAQPPPAEVHLSVEAAAAAAARAALTSTSQRVTRIVTRNPETDQDEYTEVQTAPAAAQPSAETQQAGAQYANAQSDASKQQGASPQPEASVPPQQESHPSTVIVTYHNTLEEHTTIIMSEHAQVTTKLASVQKLVTLLLSREFILTRNLAFVHKIITFVFSRDYKVALRVARARRRVTRFCAQNQALMALSMALLWYMAGTSLIGSSTLQVIALSPEAMALTPPWIHGLIWMQQTLAGCTAWLMNKAATGMAAFIASSTATKLLLTFSLASLLLLLLAPLYKAATGMTWSESVAKVHGAFHRLPGANMVAEPSKRAHTVLNLAYFCGVLVFAVFLAIVSEEVKRHYTHFRHASHPLHFHGHTLVLNWSSDTIPLLRQLDLGRRYSGAPIFKQPVVILAPRNKTEMDQELSERLPNTQLNIHTRSGNPCFPKHLSLVAAKDAHTCIVMQPNEPSPQLTEAVNAATAMALGTTGCHNVIFQITKAPTSVDYRQAVQPQPMLLHHAGNNSSSSSSSSSSNSNSSIGTGRSSHYNRFSTLSVASSTSSRSSSGSSHATSDGPWWSRPWSRGRGPSQANAPGGPAGVTAAAAAGQLPGDLVDLDGAQEQLLRQRLQLQHLQQQRQQQVQQLQRLQHQQQQLLYVQQLQQQAAAAAARPSARLLLLPDHSLQERLLCQESVQPGILGLWRRLLQEGPNAFKLRLMPLEKGLAGKSYQQARRSYPNCVVTGFVRGGQAFLNPDERQILAAGDQLVVASYAQHTATKPWAQQVFRAAAESAKQRAARPVNHAEPPKHIIVAGWRESDLQEVIQCFAEASPADSTITFILHRKPARGCSIALPKQQGRCRFQYLQSDNPSSLQTLLDAGIKTADSVVLTGSVPEHISSNTLEADAMMLTSLLQVQTAVKASGRAGHPPHVIAGVNHNSTRQIIKEYFRPPIDALVPEAPPQNRVMWYDWQGMPVADPRMTTVELPLTPKQRRQQQRQQKREEKLQQREARLATKQARQILRQGDTAGKSASQPGGSRSKSSSPQAQGDGINKTNARQGFLDRCWGSVQQHVSSFGAWVHRDQVDGIDVDGSSTPPAATVANMSNVNARQAPLAAPEPGPASAAQPQFAYPVIKRKRGPPGAAAPATSRSPDVPNPEVFMAEDVRTALLAQVATQPGITGVLRQLLTLQEGAEFVLQDPSALNIATGETVTFAEVAETARQFQRTAVGYLLASGRLVMVVEPLAQHTFRDGDQLVLIASRTQGLSARV